jgi:purine-nucleoside phosphorylase
VRLGTEAVLMLQGRIHPYERRSAEESVRAVRALAIWGVERLLLTTAVGSLHPDVGPGALWQVVDHLNLTGMNPLAGAEPPAPWTRFVDLGGAYDGPMGEVLVAAAAARSVPLRRGVYGAMPGPSYESPAEIRMLRRMDADVVGMSLVHEVIAARQIGLRTAALAVISNLAAGLSLEVLAHEDVTRAMALAVPALRGVIEEAVARW